MRVVRATNSKQIWMLGGLDYMRIHRLEAIWYWALEHRMEM